VRGDSAGFDSVGPPGPDLARIGQDLPFAAAVQDLRGAVRSRGVAVVQAPPGTGKTTLAPPVVAEELGSRADGGGVSASSGRVVVVQPRRIAARAAARRLATLTGTSLGGYAGFTVRGERRVSGATRVEFCTPGVLLRRLLADPDLPGTGAVVLDEVHERGLETDLLVGMLAEVRELREDLVLVAMSATLDATRFAALLGGEQGPAPVVDCPSALHPLEVRWVPPVGPRTDARGVADAFLEHVARAAADVHGEAATALGLASTPDTLVFVPGVREVDRVANRLRGLLPAVEVLELHGRLDPRAQDRVTAGSGPGDPPRVVVSTALAESSLTVPGVRVVVDAGLAREPRRDAARDMSGLVTVAASRDAAVQRAGRAARQGPGIAVRCYDETTFAAMPAHVTPEISVADLVGPALTLACWGAPRGEGLALPDTPPSGAIADAEAVLRRLGAVDDDGRATELGRRLAEVPADPRLARALLDGAGLVGARTAAEVVAALSDDHRPEGGDLTALLRALRRGHAPAAGRWKEEVRRLEDLASRHTASAGAPTEVSASRAQGSSPGAGGAHSIARPDERTGLVVALAHPDRVARRVGDTYLLASGTRAAAPPGSLQRHEWLAIAEVARAEGRVAAGTGAVIRSAAPLSQEAAELAAATLLTDSATATFRDHRVVSRRVRALGAIELSSVAVRPEPDDARRAVEAALSEQGLGIFTWSPAADGLRRRLALLRRTLGDPWPDVSDAALADRWPEWLGPEVDRLADGGRADRIDLVDPLRRLLPWPEASRLGELAPERLAVPSGRDVRIDYPAADDPDGRPVVAVKLQECFGWGETPQVAGVRVLFHLLSPAGRPLAVTDDLASFWSGPYAQVRAEMRGRYPKHPWPEDPWTAPATARTRR